MLSYYYYYLGTYRKTRARCRYSYQIYLQPNARMERAETVAKFEAVLYHTHGRLWFDPRSGSKKK